MKTLIINNNTKYLKDLCALFADTVVVDRKFLGDSLDLSDIGLIVISGGKNVPTVLRHPEEYASEMDFIKNTKIPIIGICLGMEIIVKTFDGELQELPLEHRGSIQLKIEDERLKLLVKSDSLEVFEGHRIGIKNLPDDFISCASSQHGIEIIKHKERLIVGFQFHPEVSKNIGLIRWMEEFLNLDSLF